MVFTEVLLWKITLLTAPQKSACAKKRTTDYQECLTTANKKCFSVFLGARFYSLKLAQNRSAQNGFNDTSFLGKNEVSI